MIAKIVVTTDLLKNVFCRNNGDGRVYFFLTGGFISVIYYLYRRRWGPYLPIHHDDSTPTFSFSDLSSRIPLTPETRLSSSTPAIPTQTVLTPTATRPRLPVPPQDSPVSSRTRSQTKAKKTLKFEEVSLWLIYN